MTWRFCLRSLLPMGVAAGLAIGMWAPPASGAAIVTTNFGADQVVVYPAPNAELPNPEALAVSGLPQGAHPHGVSCFEPDTCLISDVGNFRVFVVRVSTASVVDTIDTAAAGYAGGGTITVNPARTFALAADPIVFSGQLTVIAAPFGSGSPITTIPLAGAVQTGGTQSIAFSPSGRAFVCTGGSIAVLDPPYASIAFTMPLFTGCSELAMAPDGDTLLAPADQVVNVFTAPFTAGSTPAALSIPGAGRLAGVAVTSDNAKALVVDVSGPTIWAVSAPFSGTSAVEQIGLPPGFPSLRQIAISPDNELAILAGGDTSNTDIAFVRAPFTTAGATVFDVFILGGVGFGGASFLGPAGPPGPPPPPCGPVAATTVAGAASSAPTAAVGTLPLVAAVLPAGRSVRVGCPATAFVTVINAGATTATGVGIAPSTPVPVDFLYQTTDSTTNALTGSPNTPADIGAGQAQSFVIALTPRGPFDPTDVAFTFGGTNTAPVQLLVGINTLLLSASRSPVPDIVALAATIGNTGIVNIQGATGAGAFAVASVNVGFGAAITVSADTGGAALPVNIGVCQTEPASGACLLPPAASATTFIDGGATPTFGIFVTGNDIVGFDPAQNRVFVRFNDALGVTRGSTSVAVRTQ